MPLSISYRLISLTLPPSPLPASPHNIYNIIRHLQHSCIALQVDLPPRDISAYEGGMAPRSSKSRESPLLPLSPSDISSLSAKYFSPSIRPQGLNKDPAPPSLAWSKLPLAAEIDERPTARVRRFRLWSKATPELRIVVVDPRRRAWLVRYRTFAIPSPPQPLLGFLSPSRRPFQQTPQPLSSHLTPQLMSSPFSSDVSNDTMSSSVKVTKPPKLPRKERKMRYERLLEHKWVLDQEHERRFRRGMAAIMADILKFQNEYTMPHDDGKRLQWKEGVDVARVLDFRNFFEAVRNDSSTIYTYLNPKDIAPVPGRKEVCAQVKYEKKKKKDKKKKKEKEKEKNKEEEREKELQKENESQAVELKRRRAEFERLQIEEPEVFEGWIEFMSSAHQSSHRLSTPLPHTHNRTGSRRHQNQPFTTQDAIDDIAIRKLDDHLLGLEIESSGPHRGTDTRHDEFHARASQEAAQEVPVSLVTSEFKESTPICSYTEDMASFKLSVSPKHLRPGSLNIDDDTAFPSLPTPSITPSAMFVHTGQVSTGNYLTSSDGKSSKYRSLRNGVDVGSEDAAVSEGYGALEDELSAIAERMLLVGDD